MWMDVYLNAKITQNVTNLVKLNYPLFFY